MPASALLLSALSCISLAQETRVSKRQPCGLWAHRSSWRGSRAVCCALHFAYLPSLAAAGGPTTRRTEDCQDAGKAKRCRLLAAAVEYAPVPRSARPRAASTRPPATCRASPAARRTSVCADTEPPLYHHSSMPQSSRTRRNRVQCNQMQCNTAQHNKVRCNTVQRSKAGRNTRQRSRAGHNTRHYNRMCHITRYRSKAGRNIRHTACYSTVQRSKAYYIKVSHRVHYITVRRRRACYRPPPGALPRGMFRSPAAPTANSSSAPRNCAPNPQAINDIAIHIFIRAYSDVLNLIYVM